MNIVLRALADTDKAKSVEIEQASIQGVSYVADVWELFTKQTEGDFTGAFVEGELWGIGKLTRLFGDYGWLETLRIHPDYQRKGLGRAIYGRYMEEIEEMRLSAVGMYTNYTNIASKALAEVFGLTTRGRFSEYNCATRETGDVEGFTRIAPERAEALLAPHYPEMGEFLSLNRTFYPVQPGLGAHFGAQGWLYAHADGDLLIAGTRYQPEKALFIPFMSGDSQKLLQKAHSLAAQCGSARLSAMRYYDDAKEGEMLEKQGFMRQEEDFITMWKGL